MQRIAVVYGGFSSEGIISEKSAKNIVAALEGNEYEVVKVKITKNEWVADIGDGVPIDKNDFSYLVKGKKFLFDKAFITIHGTPGEDGRLQGYFDIIGLPYINSGVTASALTFDKWMTNRFLEHAGIPSAKAILIRKGQTIDPQEVVKKLGLPCFVKPNDCGSSFGISKVKKTEDIESAIENAFKEGEVAVIESFLDGTEVTCGAYKGSNGIVILPPTEIVSDGEFFDFAAKYEGKSKEITPARISKNLTEKISITTKKIFELINLSGLIRVDFIVTNDTPHVIEVNTTPGMSDASIVPQQIKAAGKTLSEVFNEILSLD